MRVAATGALIVVLTSCAAGGPDAVPTTAAAPAAVPTTAAVPADVTTTAAVPADVTTTAAVPADVTTTADEEVDCPRVVAVELTETAPGVFTVNTTVRSIDIEGVSYADAWEVRDLAGAVLGERILTHPHANEQPFTRSLSGVAIPTEISQVEVAARDSVRGFCGPTMIVEVPHS